MNGYRKNPMFVARMVEGDGFLVPLADDLKDIKKMHKLNSPGWFIWQKLEKVEKLRPMAEGRTLAQLALQFAVAHPAVTCVIPGAKTVKQLEENTRAGTITPLSAEELARLMRSRPKAEAERSGRHNPLRLITA